MRYFNARYFSARYFSSRFIGGAESAAIVLGASRKRRLPEKIDLYIEEQEEITAAAQTQRLVVINEEKHKQDMEELRKMKKRKIANYLLFQ